MLGDIKTGAAFYEFGELDKLRSQVRNNDKNALTAVARQFESLFTRMMLKSMRDASLGDPMFDSQTTKFYQDMADDQLAVNMATSGSMGLADMLVRQMERHLPKKEGETTAPPSSAPIEIKYGDFINRISRSLKDEQGKVEEQPQRYVAPSLDVHRSKKSFVIDKDDSAMALPESGFTGSPQSFVEKLWPLAQQYGEELGVNPKVLLAQAALETGWGKHVLRQGDQYSFNLFNIKADQRWQGDSISKSSLEFSNGLFQPQQSRFRVYSSFEESFADYVEFIKTSPRYQTALGQGADAESYLIELQNAGYATDPKYAEKIKRLLNDQPLQSADAV